MRMKQWPTSRRLKKRQNNVGDSVYRRITHETKAASDSLSLVHVTSQSIVEVPVPDGTVPKSSGFISHSHLARAHRKHLGRGGTMTDQALSHRCESITVEESNILTEPSGSKTVTIWSTKSSMPFFFLLMYKNASLKKIPPHNHISNSLKS